jgi:hypothetical protein
MAGQKILLDSPARHPALGYQEIAQAFAQLITDSDPKFAVGIFGGWGSGKTTLMRAIRQRLGSNDEIVAIDFNAWRFEREPQLIVPLLDTIREELADRAQRLADRAEGATVQSEDDYDNAARLRAIVVRLGRIVRALATGLSGSVGIPGAVTVSYDMKHALEAFAALSSDQEEPFTDQQSLTPKSLYVAAFKELRTAVFGLGDAGVDRIVVFVDDLDRCLPGSALEVLESIKLFFDLEGFIFVVGLDESVIDRAICAKLALASLSAGSSEQVPALTDPLGSQLGKEYAKKIFQVPYTLPAMLPDQLDDLLESMYEKAGIEGDQLRDLQQRVRPYLGQIAVRGHVNPREVKRFINAYTLQTLIRDDLFPEVILALQALAFRREWAAAHELVNSHPKEFVAALRRYRTGNYREFDGIPADPDFPVDLAEFLRSPQAEKLAEQESLDPYLSSLRSTRIQRIPGEAHGLRGRE